MTQHYRATFLRYDLVRLVPPGGEIASGSELAVEAARRLLCPDNACDFAIENVSWRSVHARHGRGDESGPDDSDCGCRDTLRQFDCALAGCGFCSAAEARKEPSQLPFYYRTLVRCNAPHIEIAAGSQLACEVAQRLCGIEYDSFIWFRTPDDYRRVLEHAAKKGKPAALKK